MHSGGPSWSPVSGVCCPFISLTASNRATLPSPGDHEGHPYGSSGLVLVFMASVDAYEGRYIGTYGCPDYFVKLHYRQVTSENTMVGVMSNLHYYNMVLVLASGTVSGIWGLILFFMKKPINRPWRISLIVTAVVAALQALLGISLVLLGQKPGTGTGLYYLHYVYGAIVVLAIPIAITYATGGKNQRRDTLIFSIAALVLVAAALRALTTGLH